MANIGIDFGTTNSLLVAYDKRLNKFTYFSYDGERPVPISSTVWYHDDQIVVGSEARENIHRYSEMAGHHFEKSTPALSAFQTSIASFLMFFSISDAIEEGDFLLPKTFA